MARILGASKELSGVFALAPTRIEVLKELETIMGMIEEEEEEESGSVIVVCEEAEIKSISHARGVPLDVGVGVGVSFDEDGSKIPFM